MSTAAPETISDELNIPEAEPKEPKEERSGRGRPPGAKNKGPDATFFDRLKDLDWERHVVYLYRLQPLIDLATAGGSKYVTKYAEPFDEDRVMRDLGSGMYQARLTELQGTTGKSKQIDTYNFEVFNMKYPPQIPVGVWLEDHRNERWKWAKDLLTAEQNKPQGERGSNGQDVGKQVKEVLQEIRQGQVSPTDQFNAMVNAHQAGVKQGIETAKQPPATADDSALKLLIPVITAALTVKDKPADDPVLGMMKLQLDMQREQNKADREQAKADREAAEKRAESAEKRHNDLMTLMMNRKETSGLESVEQFAKIFAAVKGIGEGGLVAPTDNTLAGVFMDGLRDALPDVLRSVAPGVGQMLGGIGGAPRPAPPLRTLAPGAPPPPPPTTSQPAPPPQADPHIGAYQCVFMNQAALLNAVKSGKPGIEFGDWLVEGHGPLEIEKLKAAGVDRIVAFISQQVPAMWAELQPFEMKFRAFLSELMSWTPADEEEEDQPADPPADPAAEPVFPGKAKSKKKGAN